ncbi:hypothetical protein RI844_09435 [Thalassotalea fonticola]|uniref:GlyGly-CTERM sorting domain-containing protein n=1 Tax=Thalassotalea fonticola TaxID=3065649 RepID=A0ABZ0GUS1_9GAMM|nr:hypothetical protein RI844_09435 [Colwelliaceae bacterium S1-1]
MKSTKQSSVKLSSLTKAIALALTLPVAVHAAEDPNFPDLSTSGETVMSHKSETGLNLLHNGTLETCIKDVDANNDYFTANPASLCDTEADYTWGFANFSRSTDTGDGSTYSLNSKLAKGTRKADPEFVSVTGVTKLYLKADIKVLAAGGSKADRLRIKIPKKADPSKYAYLNIDMPTAAGDWETVSKEFDLTGNINFDVPYTGDIAFFMATEDGNEVLVDNVIMFSDVDFDNYEPVSNAPDTDGDGFSDDDENAVFSDPNDIDITPLNADNDDDGYLNTEEIAAGTDHEDPFDNPGSVDTDGDGYFDAEEIAEGSDVNDINKTPIDLDGDGYENSLLSSGSIYNGTDSFPENADASMDSDDDGYPDQYNVSCDDVCQESSELILDAATMIDRYEAYLDVDLDGQPESFIVAECKEGNVIEGADLAECNGLILDTDFDSDEDSYSDQVEEEAGSDPLNANSTPLDLDGDGWENAADFYPDNAYGSLKGTNVLDNLGDNIVPNTGNWDANKLVATDRNGEESPMYKIIETSSETRITGPEILIPQGNEATIVRISAWLKLSGIDDLSVLDKIFIRGLVKHSYEDGTKVTKRPGYYVNTANEDGIAKEELLFNNGWVRVESFTELEEAITHFQPELALKAKGTGELELIIDDLEVSFVENHDTDEDLIIDVLDMDDDNDSIKDGLDESPLGDNSVDLDADGIWDAYDDDLDNDLIANALDTSFTPLIPSELEVVDNGASFMVTADAIADTNVTYRWLVRQPDGSETELGESGNSIAITVADYPEGFQVLVKVVAETIDDESLVKQTVVQMPGEKQNFVPQISDTEPTTDNLADSITFTADVFDIDEDDIISYAWTVNGIALDDTTSALSIKNSDYPEPGTSLEITLTVSDGKDTATKTWNVITNQLPEVNIVKTAIDADVTTFSVGYEDTDGNLVLGVQDVEMDSFTYLWSMTVDGVDYPLEETEANGREFSIDRFDFQAGSVIELSITVTDMNRATHVVTQTVSHTLTPIATENTEDEIYPEGEDGGATWWLLALLVPAFIRRRFCK